VVGFPMDSGRSGARSFDAGAAGNLKFCEKDPDAFLPAVPTDGGFGAVETPGFLRLGRTGRENSGVGSCMVGGEEPPGVIGEECAGKR
jgi:hypothetical protein